MLCAAHYDRIRLDDPRMRKFWRDTREHRRTQNNMIEGTTSGTEAGKVVMFHGAPPGQVNTSTRPGGQLTARTAVAFANSAPKHWPPIRGDQPPSGTVVGAQAARCASTIRPNAAPDR
jgi:hypothetical protein